MIVVYRDTGDAHDLRIGWEQWVLHLEAQLCSRGKGFLARLLLWELVTGQFSYVIIYPASFDLHFGPETKLLAFMIERFGLSMQEQQQECSILFFIWLASTSKHVHMQAKLTRPEFLHP